MTQTKGFIVGQLNTLKRKREIEAPLSGVLPEKTLEQVEKAKRVLHEL